jgi:CBS domain-containing protein
MQIGSLITRAVLTVERRDTLADAAMWMMERGVGSAVVMADDKPVGLVTDRDALRAIAQDVDFDAVSVGDFVPRKLTRATPDMDVMEAARIMREKGFRHLVVVDDEGSLVGVFSMRDLVVGLLQERLDMVRSMERKPATAGAEPAD